MIRSCRKKVVSALCALALAAGTAVTVSPGANATPIYPSKVKDPYFQVPKSKYQNLTHGKLIKSRSMKLPQFPRTMAEQMVFASTNSHGEKIFSTALLLRQAHSYALPNVPTLVYNHFINSLGTECQPTFSLTTPINQFNNVESLTTAAEITAGLNAALTMGWNILLPDFEGLQGAYGATILAGHLILDAVTALVTTPKFNSRHSKVILGGYSGGAMTTVIAAAMAPKYAPIPHFVGAAAGGTPADMEWMGKALGNRPNPGFGILAGTMIGLEREYPDRMNIYDRMRPEWKKRMRNGLKDSCVSTMVASFSGQSMRTVFNNVDVYKQHREFKVVRENSPLYYPLNPKMPLYFYHGNQDIAVPVAKLKQLAHRYCKAGTHVTLATMDLSEHLLVGFVGLPGALAWAQSRFAGLPAPNDFCEGREYNILPLGQLKPSTK